MDDAGAAAALPSLRHVRHRQCPADRTTSRALVFALALRSMARRQRSAIEKILLRAFKQREHCWLVEREAGHGALCRAEPNRALVARRRLAPEPEEAVLLRRRRGFWLSGFGLWRR